MKRGAALLACCLGLAVPATALAQNPRRVLIGGRTATMGGAGTAAGNDSAMPYLNPAGVAGLPGDVVAVSASVYAYQKRSFEEFFAPAGYDPQFGTVTVEREDVSSSGFSELPSSVMFVKHLTPNDEIKHVLGVSLVIPYHSRDTITASYKANSTGILGSLDSSRALASSRTTYYFGPTYAAKLPWLRAGISGYGVYDRFTDTTLTALHIDTLGGTVPQSFRGERSQTSEAFGLAAILGAQVETIEHLWFGAAVALPSVHVTGRTLANDEVSSVTADAATGAAIANSSRGSFDGTAKAQSPFRVNVGVAYDDRKRFSVAADAWWFASRSDAGVIDGTHTFHESRTGETSRIFSRKEKVSANLAGVIDLSLGGEVVVTEVLALRAGAFTDFSNLPKDEPLTLADQYGSRLDRLGATLGVGLTLGSFDTTVGAYYVHGSGTFNALDHTSAAAITNGARVVTTNSTSDSIGIILSTVVTIEEAKDTMRKNLPVKGPLL